jgi:hypothetical protein
MAAIFFADLGDAFYKAEHAIMPIHIRLGVGSSSYVNYLNALLTEISQFLLPALEQPGVNTATIFFPNQREYWIQQLLEWNRQLEKEAMDVYQAGSHVALLEVAIVRVIASLNDIQ